MPALLRAPTREYRTTIMDSHRWDRFEPRSDDIVICTYSKCGTTWMQRIVDLLIFQTPEPRPVVLTAPWLDATLFAPIEQDLATLAAQTHRRFVKTHMPFDSVPLFDEVKYIHVARDGRDACMSLHNHLLGFRPEMRERFRQLASQDPRFGIRGAAQTPEDPREFYLRWIGDAEADATEGYGIDLPFFEFENTYWKERRRENLLLVHFNDLKVDLAGEMRRVANYLEIAIPDNMDELVEAATFSSMKRNGDAIMPIAKMAWDKGADRFLNKGTNNRWKDVLTEEDVARYVALAAKKWTKATRAWVTNGRLIAGDPRLSED